MSLGCPGYTVQAWSSYSGQIPVSQGNKSVGNLDGTWYEIEGLQTEQRAALEDYWKVLEKFKSQRIKNCERKIQVSEGEMKTLS